MEAATRAMEEVGTEFLKGYKRFWRDLGILEVFGRVGGFWGVLGGLEVFGGFWEVSGGSFGILSRCFKSLLRKLTKKEVVEGWFFESSNCWFPTKIRAKYMKNEKKIKERKKNKKKIKKKNKKKRKKSRQ